MSIFRLIKTEMTVFKKRSEEVYFYHDDLGRKVKFHAHPTKAFNFVIYKNDKTSSEVANAIVAAWCKQGSRQHDYPGGFNEAIAELYVDV